MEIAVIVLSLVVAVQSAAIFILIKRKRVDYSEFDESVSDGNRGDSPAVKHMKRKHKKKAIGSAVCNRTKQLREDRG